MAQRFVAGYFNSGNDNKIHVVGCAAGDFIGFVQVAVQPFFVDSVFDVVGDCYSIQSVLPGFINASVGLYETIGKDGVRVEIAFQDLITVKSGYRYFISDKEMIQVCQFVHILFSVLYFVRHISLLVVCKDKDSVVEICIFVLVIFRKYCGLFGWESCFLMRIFAP